MRARNMSRRLGRRKQTTGKARHHSEVSQIGQRSRRKSRRLSEVAAPPRSLPARFACKEALDRARSKSKEDRDTSTARECLARPTPWSVECEASVFDFGPASEWPELAIPGQK